MSDDLVQRLRRASIMRDDLCSEAAAEIERLRAELTAFRAFLTERGCGGVGDANGMHDLAQHHEELIADNERQAARISRLEAALRPFAEAFQIERADGNIIGRAEFKCRLSIEVGVCLAAAAALADAPE